MIYPKTTKSKLSLLALALACSGCAGSQKAGAQASSGGASDAATRADGDAGVSHTYTQRNILFIAVDDLKPTLGAYGDVLAHTPNMDALADAGVAFMHAYCQQAVCAPSRASLMTGLRPDSTRVWDLKTLMRDENPDIVTLPQYLQGFGYETAALGKIFDSRAVDGEHDAPSWSAGYHPAWSNSFFGGYAGSTVMTRVNELKTSGTTGWSEIQSVLEAEGLWTATEVGDVPDENYGDAYLTEQAMAQLGTLSQGSKPFFLAVGYQRPHLPFTAPQAYWELFDRAAFEIHPFQKPSQDGPGIAYHDFGELRRYSDIPETGPVAESKQKELIHGYYAATSFVDAQIGRLLDKLRELELDDDTVVVLWGDHGWHLGDHGLWAKHSNFEQAAAAPLIIYDPGNPPDAHRVSGMAEFVDVFPTLCQMNAVPVPEFVEGKSLTPLLQDRSASVNEIAVHQYPRGHAGQPHMGYAARDQRFRYVQWLQMDYYAGETTGPVAFEELYDYDNDPLERVNLANDPAFADEVARLQSLLAQTITR